MTLGSIKQQEAREKYFNDVFLHVWRANGETTQINQFLVERGFWDGIAPDIIAKRELLRQQGGRPCVTNN